MFLQTNNSTSADGSGALFRKSALTTIAEDIVLETSVAVGVVQGGRMAATCEPPAESQVDRLPRRLRPGATGPQRKHTNKRARSIFTAIHFFHSELGKGVERTDPPTPMSQGLKLPSTSGLG